MRVKTKGEDVVHMATTLQQLILETYGEWLQENGFKVEEDGPDKIVVYIPKNEGIDKGA